MTAPPCVPGSRPTRPDTWGQIMWRPSDQTPVCWSNYSDTGQRLLVHFHPDREFARRHLDCPHGKTEAWYITDVSKPDGDAHDDDSLGLVYLGFTEDVSEQTVDRWMSGQRADDMLAALNKIAVEPGDTFLVPAGTPHAIGAGITLVELQEPVDFSILLEWAGFDIDGPTQGHLGVGFDVALTGLDRSAWTPQRLATLREQRPDAQIAPGITALFPAAADEFFRAELLSIRDSTVSTFAPGFSVLITLDGVGTLEAAGRSLPLRKGTTVLVPYAAGDLRITGPVDAVRCLPPTPPPSQR